MATSHCYWKLSKPAHVQLWIMTIKRRDGIEDSYSRLMKSHHPEPLFLRLANLFDSPVSRCNQQDKVGILLQLPLSLSHFNLRGSLIRFLHCNICMPIFFYSNLKMTSERCKRRSLLSLISITRSLSKKLLIKVIKVVQ